MKKLIAICIAVVLMLPAAACGRTAESTSTLQPPQMATSPPLPPPAATNTYQPRSMTTNTPESFIEGECNPATDPVGMNTRVSKRVQGGSYPDACEVFCLWVPEGSLLEIGISSFVADLDLYVDRDSSILQPGDNGRWESDAYGTVDEQVTIRDPAGHYYIKVCSYDGVPSTFMLWNDFSP